jgi:RNA polymerase sigma-70 factor (ECF subfamily)
MSKINLTVEEIEDLAELAKEGDTVAFGSLYDFFIDPIYRYIYFKVDRDDALDLTETVFLKVWENMKSYRPGALNGSFSSWLYKIAHNVVVDHYRLAKKYMTLSDNLPDEKQSNNPAHITEEKMSSESLRQAIRKLKRSYQQVILLKYINELENREIARILKRSEGSLRILKFRALKALKGVLEGMNIKY